MPSHPTLGEPAIPLELQAQDVLFYREVLNELIILGKDLARQLAERPAQPDAQPQADTAPAAPTLAPDRAIGYDRVARSIRRSMALARTLAAPLAAAPRIAARKRIIRAVEDTIGRETDGEAAQRLGAELRERMDAPDMDDDIDSRPVLDIITDICHDLGLAGMPGASLWNRRTPADIAALCTLAARPRATPPAAPPPHATPPATPTGPQAPDTT